MAEITRKKDWLIRDVILWVKKLNEISEQEITKSLIKGVYLEHISQPIVGEFCWILPIVVIR